MMGESTKKTKTFAIISFLWWNGFSPFRSNALTITRSSCVASKSTALNQWRHEAGDNADETSNMVNNGPCSSRREATTSMMVSAIGGAVFGHMQLAHAAESSTEKESMFAPSFVQSYPDFTVSSSGGWSFKDVSAGSGSGQTPKLGDRVVFDWSGYTIGYFGRPFEAKGGPQGGAFDKDLDYFRTVLGQHTVVPALEEAFQSMKPGQVRQVIVPYGKYGYPQETDPKHEQVGPKPTTFSGQRALNFVLDNPRVDRTLLFNVKLIRIDRPDGKGGYVRGDKA